MMATYVGYNSIHTQSRFNFLLTTPVVPVPLNGSSTVSPSRVVARIQGSTMDHHQKSSSPTITCDTSARVPPTMEARWYSETLDSKKFVFPCMDIWVIHSNGFSAW